MKEEYKETLTKENILSDVKKHFLKEIKIYPIVLICFSLVALIYRNIDISKFVELKFILIIFIFCVLIVFSAIIYSAVGLIFSIYNYLTLSKRLIITEDWLKGYTTRFSFIFIQPSVVHSLNFAKHGYLNVDPNTITVFKTILYPWSENFSMTDTTLIKTSNRNDEFYLAVVGKKIISVYNKKFFILEE